MNLAIRAAGWGVVAIPTAKAVHHHPYTRRSLLRQAWFGGASVAEIQWRYGLGFRKDLGPIFAAWGLLLVGILLGPLVSWWTLLLPVPVAALAIAAISFNELRNKGKTPLELLRASPALVVYYHVRLAGWFRRRVQLRLGIQPIDRVSPETLASAMPRPERGP